MKSTFLKSATALGFVAALAVSVPQMAGAAPFGAGTGEALKSANTSDVTEVRHRGRGGRYLAYGVGGLLLGSALAYPYYRGGYGYGPNYAYSGGQKCWYQTGPYRGQGYWGWC